MCAGFRLRNIPVPLPVAYVFICNSGSGAVSIPKSNRVPSVKRRITR